MSEAEYARHRGISRQYVNRLVQEGRIVKNGDDVDVRASDANLNGQISMDSARGGTKAQAELAKLLISVERDRDALQKERGKLVPVADQAEAWEQVAAALRDAVLSIPDRIAPRLAELTSARDIRTELLRELRTALTALPEVIARV